MLRGGGLTDERLLTMKGPDVGGQSHIANGCSTVGSNTFRAFYPFSNVTAWRWYF